MMGETLLALALVVHIASTALLAAFGLHRLYLAWGYRRYVARPQRTRPRPPDDLPSVTVQLPLFNERYVAERALRAAAALDYPRDRLEIQILDDSTDDTSEHVAALTRDLRAQGHRIHHVRRANRDGFKAGALSAGLALADGELIAIFDADFAPRPGFLREVVGEFADPSVGMVQARWSHLNAGHSLLTRIQALQLDAHFTVEHGVRAARGLFFNFNGTAGVWRRDAIRQSGGWQAHTLTEDLDLSYRAQLAGWRFVYRDDVEVPGELPVEMAAYRQQQQRWAQGGVQTTLRILPHIARAPLSRAVKWEAGWHLLSHFTYPLLVLVAVAGLAVGTAAGGGGVRWVLGVDGALLTFAMVSLGVFYGVTAHARNGRMDWRRLALVPGIMIVGAGIALGQTAAVARAITGQPTPFRRTPKYRLGSTPTVGWRGAAYRIPTGAPAILELLTGATLLAGGAMGAMWRDAFPSALVWLFGIGFLCVGGASIAQATKGGR